MATSEKSQSQGLMFLTAGLASITAATVVHPVDLIKIRLQIEGETSNPNKTRAYGNIFKGIRTVVQYEGFGAIYKGLLASWARESVYSTLRIGLYEPFKKLLGATDPANTGFFLKLFAAGSSGFIGAAVSNPMDIVKVIMQAQEAENPKSISWIVRDIWQTQGIAGFYVAVVPTIIRAVMLNGTKLAWYDHIKHTILNLGMLTDGYLTHFISSCIAGVAMACVTCPVDIVKTRMMNQPRDNPIYRNMFHCAQTILKGEGPFGFYKGWTACCARFGPYTVVQLMTWEKLRNLLGMQGI